MSFKRSPSKVWWASESLEFREVSSSPGSQDSGFSDTDTSPSTRKNKELEDENKLLPHQTTPKKATPTQCIPKEIFKELECDNVNLTSNCKEKTTPNKIRLGGDRLVKSDRKDEKENVGGDNGLRGGANTDPVKRQRYTKNSPKVNRNLFDAKQERNDNNNDEHKVHNQYSKGDTVAVEESISESADETTEESISDDSEHNSTALSTKSLPNHTKKHGTDVQVSSRDLHNQTAPAVLIRRSHDNNVDAETAGFGPTSRFNNSVVSSDCESELECLFEKGLESPKHTSTPKAGSFSRMRKQRRSKLPLEMYLKYQQELERVPPPHPDLTTITTVVANPSVQKWLSEARFLYEPECTSALQCKSIVAELNQKVSLLAAETTSDIREVLQHCRRVEAEYRRLNSESRQVEPLIQGLAEIILDFLKTHTSEISSKTLKLYDEIRTSKSEDSLRLLSRLFSIWETIQTGILVNEVKNLVDKLEKPSSELDLRATVTGITSISLRNEDLIELFIKADIIPILLILCEKCEGSSLRTLILRALSTMCCHSKSLCHIEKFSGIQLISDTIEDQSRPEPEKSEAIALLAQITAPWLEDNHSLKGLNEYSKRLVKSLTKFVSKTRCCQNLLLSTAALANLSTMDTKSIKHMIQINTAKSLLSAVNSRGLMVSVYLLEQVATLLANMSAVEAARRQLTEINAPTALIFFLKASHLGEDVEKRLQQKSIIALSRLCGEKEACRQVVELGGVEKLVKMCREKEERHDSDAVLVAALATLRKIVDACGTKILSQQDAQELVEPKLLDSFLAYSTQNESYV